MREATPFEAFRRTDLPVRYRTDPAEALLRRPLRLRLRLAYLLDHPVPGGEWAQVLAACRRDLAEAAETAEALAARVGAMPGHNSLRDAVLLRLRYVQGLKGEALRAAMEARGYAGSLQAVYYWQKSALRRGNAILSDGADFFAPK